MSAILDMENRAPAASVVVEWYNQSHARLQRPKRMLAALAAQGADLRRATPSGTLELIFVHNGDERAVAQLRGVLDEIVGPDEFAIKIVAAHGATYCKLKNVGAAAASGDIIIFLDSDVVPEPGWLAAFLRAFADPGVSAAVGNTYVDYGDGGVYSKAMALTWMFPLRDAHDGLSVSTWFYSNNVAFRRQTFLARPFPDTPGFIHLPAKLLVERLERDGIVLWHVGGARVSHPPPNGARHFIARAVAAGRTRALSPGLPRAESAVESAGKQIREILWHAKRVVVLGSRVGLRWWQLPAAVVYAAGYHFFILAGYLISVSAPRVMRHRFDL